MNRFSKLFLGMALAVFLAAPSISFAETNTSANLSINTSQTSISELQAMIKNLQSQIEAMSAAKKEIPQIVNISSDDKKFCHVFTTDMSETVANNTSDVVALNTIFEKEGIITSTIENKNIFVANRVEELQKKYAVETYKSAGLSAPTRTVGRATKAFLNRKYACAGSLIDTPETNKINSAITIVNPANGKNFPVTDALKVSWKGNNNGEKFLMAVTADGDSYTFPGESIDPSVGYYVWTGKIGDFPWFLGKEGTYKLVFFAIDKTPQMTDNKVLSSVGFTIGKPEASKEKGEFNVDLIINGSDTPEPVEFNTPFTASWKSNTNKECVTWGGPIAKVDGGSWLNQTLPTFGDQKLLALNQSFGYTPQIMIGIQCLNKNSLDDSIIDSITLKVSLPKDGVKTADLDSNGKVNAGDLAILAGAWGKCTTEKCIADFNYDTVVNEQDLNVLMSYWTK